MRSVKVLDFVKEMLEEMKDELDFKSESEVIYYLLQVFHTYKSEITLMEHVEYRDTYKVEKEREETTKNNDFGDEKVENDID